MMHVRLVVLFIVAAVILDPSLVFPQSKDEGIAVWNEAWKTETGAASRPELEKALTQYEQALGIFEKVGFDEGILGVCTNLGKVNCTLGRYAKGREHYQKAVDVSRRIGSPRGEAQGLSGLGGVSFDLAQYDKAIEYYNAALAAYRKVGDQEWEGLTLNHIGEVFRERGQHSKAVEFYGQALAICRRSGSPECEADTRHNIGEATRLQGHYASALEHYQKALSVYRQLADKKHEAIALGNVGTVHKELGQYAKAMESYRRSLEIFGEMGAVREQGRAFLDMGRLQESLGKFDDALKTFQEGLRIYELVGMPTGLPKKLIGDVYLDTGRPEQAASFLKEAGSASSLGRLHLAKGEYKAASAHYGKLLESAQLSGNAEDLFTSYTALGKVSEALEDYLKAEEYYERGMKLTEELRSMVPPTERTHFFEVKIEGFSRSEPAKGLTRVRMKLNRAAHSIDSSELTRARAFADAIAMRSEAGVTGVPQEILKKEDELISMIAALKKDRDKVEADEHPERRHNITREIAKAENELTKLVALLWEKYTFYAAVKHPRPVTIKESALRPDECVVMFDVSAEGVGIKLIKNKAIAQTHYKKWQPADLEEQVRSLRKPFEAMESKGRAALREFDPDLAEELYKNLLAPVMMDVPRGAPIIIIPDAILAILPFEALVVGGKARWRKGRHGDYPEGLTYLGDVHPVSYYQSINALTVVRTLAAKKKPGDRLLVVADPVFHQRDERIQGSGSTNISESDYPQKLMATIEDETGKRFRFGRLPETATLAENLGKLHGAGTDLYVGLQANKATFLSEIVPRLDQYRWIVFATHGFFGTKGPGLLEPFLALTMVPSGTDGFLKMSDVMSLRLNADIVALTACRTGLGTELSGEGVMSMGRAFQYAGARSVLMTLWPVAEKSSVMLTESFFRLLKQGKSKLEAIKMARSELRTTGYDHPFFWAGFVLVGETE